MNKILSLIALGLALSTDPKAKALKGDQRKKFMSECLKG